MTRPPKLMQRVALKTVAARVLTGACACLCLSLNTAAAEESQPAPADQSQHANDPKAKAKPKPKRSKAKAKTEKAPAAEAKADSDKPPAPAPKPAPPQPEAAHVDAVCKLRDPEQPRGGRLDVLGQRFGSAPVVRIAGKPARILVRRQDRISVQVPADSNGGEITLLDDGKVASCGTLVIIGKDR